MSEAFESSRRKIERAEKHMVDLEREIDEFQQINPYKRVIDPHPDKPNHQVHKIRLTKELPKTIGDIAFDIVGNLRAALDNAAYATALAVAKSGAELKNTAFPFAGSIGQMASSLGRSKDVPREIQSMFFGFQPSVITSKAANSYHFKTGQREWPSRTENVLPCRLLWWQVGFSAPTPRTALEHVSVVQQAVEHGADGGCVAQQFAPVFHRTVRS